MVSDPAVSFAVDGGDTSETQWLVARREGTLKRELDDIDPALRSMGGMFQAAV